MWLLFGLSLGLASPPDNVDLSLIDKWNDGAEAMLDGTNGCWELVGHASGTGNLVDLGRRGAKLYSLGVFKRGSGPPFTLSR